MASEETPAEGDTGSSMLLNQPVVIDNGTATLKAGFAGSSKPKVRLVEETLNGHWMAYPRHLGISCVWYESSFVSLILLDSSLV
jgi:hypothetical protein